MKCGGLAEPTITYSCTFINQYRNCLVIVSFFRLSCSFNIVVRVLNLIDVMLATRTQLPVLC